MGVLRALFCTSTTAVRPGVCLTCQVAGQFIAGVSARDISYKRSADSYIYAQTLGLTYYAQTQSQS